MTRQEEFYENTIEVSEGLRMVKPRRCVYVDGKKVGSGKYIQVDSEVSTPRGESSSISQTSESIIQNEVNDVTTK